MAQRRKSLSEKDVRTILAVVASLKEYCNYSWSKMNTFIGSMTLDEMLDLEGRLSEWYHADDPDYRNWEEEML